VAASVTIEFAVARADTLIARKLNIAQRAAGFARLDRAWSWRLARIAHHWAHAMKISHVQRIVAHPVKKRIVAIWSVWLTVAQIRAVGACSSCCGGRCAWHFQAVRPTTTVHAQH